MGKTVLVFGSFDPLHQGHRDFFKQAKTLGDKLVVVVARDSTIKSQKNRLASQPESHRLAAVKLEENIDEAVLGDAEPESYEILKTLELDILALGYDQQPGDEKVRQLLDEIGKGDVKIVRLRSYKPEKFNSSRFRNIKSNHK